MKNFNVITKDAAKADGKNNKIKVVLYVILVLAIIASILEIKTGIQAGGKVDVFGMSCVFSSLTIAFASLTKKDNKKIN